MSRATITPQESQEGQLHFTPDDFDHEIPIATAYDLGNENFFPPSKVRFSNRASAKYDSLLPAFVLASRILMALPQTFALFIDRKPPTNDYVDQDDVIPRSSEEIRLIIKSMIPDIDTDPDMSTRSEELAMTYLQPTQSFDLVVLDTQLLRAAKDPYTKPIHKAVSLFFIAVLICREYAHILEFRCIRKKQSAPSREPFRTPPEATYAKAGLS